MLAGLNPSVESPAHSLTSCSLIDFRKEMRLAQANWQINIYSDAKHSFTGEGVGGHRTPEAERHPQTEARSWPRTVEFVREVLSLALI
jgi:dienelactone hydrolase